MTPRHPTRETPVPPSPAERDVLHDVRPGDRWLVAVAHPDDESFGCGSVIARAASLGAEVTVACATRGEAGETTVAVDPADLGALREAELHRAAARLGAARVELLGWRDSGFDGEPPPGSLCASEQAALVEVLQGLLHDVRPHVTVVLDGSDGHRDHDRMRTSMLAAVARAARRGCRTCLVEHCLPNSLMRRWLAETVATRGGDAYHALDPTTLGRPDDEVTDVLDGRSVLDRREAAIAEHRSQGSPFDGLSPDLRRAFLAEDHLHRVPVEPAWSEPRGVDPRSAYWDLGGAAWRPWPDSPAAVRGLAAGIAAVTSGEAGSDAPVGSDEPVRSDAPGAG